MSLNHIVLLGRLTRDPEVRTTNSGSTVANFGIAVDRDYLTNGNRETDFFACSAFGKTAEFVAKYFSKGRAIVVSGEMCCNRWTAQDGSRRETWQVHVRHAYFADSKKDSARDEDAEELSEEDLPF